MLYSEQWNKLKEYLLTHPEKRLEEITEQELLIYNLRKGKEVLS